MKNLYYYKTDVGNIGDDLNKWLWPDLIDLNNIKENITFIGIGSILTPKLEDLINFSSTKKITLGSGIRGIDTLPSINSEWDFSFLRGPISSLFLTGNLDNYITDGAYCLRLHSEYKELKKTEKKYPISFMPYLRTSDLIPWESICKELGIHYISPHPTLGIKQKLEEIAASEYIITEAMHGAILADIFRIPWTKFQFASHLFEGTNTNELKWQDWTRSLELTFKTHISVEFPKKVTYLPQLYKPYIKFKKNSLTNEIKKSLSSIIKDSPSVMSNESIIDKIDQKLHHKIHEINKLF